MKDRKDLGNEALDRLGRRLVQAARADSGGGASAEAAFMAGFRRKLAADQQRRLDLLEGIGAWGWRLGPMLVPATAALGVTFFFLSGSASSTQAQTPRTVQTALWTAVAEEPAELTGEAVLDAILLAERR